MVYCLSTDVYRVSGITSDEVGSTNVDSFIQAAVAEVDRYTGTIWLFDANTDTTGTVTSATTTTISDTGKTWTSDEFNDDYLVYIKSGTGSGQVREITDTTTTTLTVSSWTTNPDSTSKYEIFYGDKVTETIDGTGNDTMFVNKHPLFNLSSLTIDSTSVTPSYVYQYNNSGKLILSDDAEVQTFRNYEPQLVDISYYYGVRPDTRMKYLIRDFTAVIAGMMTLTAQIGGTFDDVTSYSFPEFSASKGEPYTNIRDAWMRLEQRMRVMKPLIPRYVHIG